MRIACLLLFWATALSSAAPAYAAPQAAFAQAVEEAKSAIMADPQGALPKISAAIRRAEGLQGREAAIGRATALWLKAEANIGLNRLTEAEAVLRQALPLATRYAPDSKLLGDLMRARGATAALRGDMQGALRDYLAAHRIFRAAKEQRSQAIALQDIGQLYWEAGDYARMLTYTEQAQELYDDDPAFSLTTSNNRGEALRMLDRRAEAEKQYTIALGHARVLGSSLLEMRILSNLASLQSELGKFADAQRNAERALRLSEAPEASDWRPFVSGTLGKIALARGDKQRALALLGAAFAGVDLGKTDTLHKEFHELAMNLYEEAGATEQALAHAKAFQRLDGEARDLTASAGSQLLAARFDFANQNLRIAQLKQGQLQRDVQIERQRVTYRTRLFLALAVAGAIVLALITFAFFSIRRSRNEVRAANDVLTQVNEDLEKALKAKSDFLAMTSHEIRTPLNGILGMAQVMLASPRLVGEQREQVELVHGAGETMRALVDDILDVAKMETGKTAICLAATPLRPLLEDTVAQWRTKATAKGLVLEADFAIAPERIETDSDKLRQIVSNLLSNAVKFTTEGTVRLNVKADRAADTLAISVEDTGIGIPTQEQMLIFEPFHQVDCAMTRQFSGTGLGLSICRNLAGALGGTILLDSTPGSGSRFTVLLPLREAAAAPVTRAAVLAEARVGIVEANGVKRGMVTGLVGPHVREACGVADGAAALDLLAQDAVDALLIDAASIASATGWLPALAQLIARAHAQQVATVVLLAPDDLPVEPIAAMRPTALLLKPVKAGDLLRALRSAIEDVEEPLRQVA